MRPSSNPTTTTTARRRKSAPRAMIRRRTDDAAIAPSSFRNHSLLLLAALSFLPSVDSLGYLKLPRSRNFVAYEDTVWWPRTETDPEPETTPQGLDRGGTLAQCGIVETLRNYDLPKNIFGDLMPVNVQEVYQQEDEITIEVSLISSNGGHFQFSLCPLEWGEVPTQECFDAHPLEFVKDNYYGATEDPNYPERIYVPDGDVQGRVDDTTGFPGNKQEFSYQMRLPCGLSGDLVLLQWYFVTAQDCYHEGYLEYDFPESWGDVFEEKINECPNPLPPSGDGLPLQYWNCAEIQILDTGYTDRCAPTAGPTRAPTGRPTRRPTGEPTVDPTSEPTGLAMEPGPEATCDEICLVPIEPRRCLFDDGDALPPCLGADGRSVFVGDLCEGSGECNTSDELDNCPGGYDVYERVPSCAKDDAGVTPEDVPISLPVLDNDVGNGLEVVDFTQPEHGLVELGEDGELVYTPDPGYNGPDDFEYSVIDENGFLSDADVDVEVTPVNDPPVANDDFATTPANTNINVPVLDNDSDPDGDSFSLTSTSQPENGTAGIRPDGTIVYKPDPDFVGTDSFTYTICDTGGLCDDGTVTVTVEPPPNAPPDARDDFVTIGEGMDPGPTIPVLANDVDPNGDPLMVTEVTVPENGSTTISPTSAGVIYTPDEGFTGVDTFEYTTCDPDGLCDTATVTVTVVAANNDPIVFDDRVSTPENEPVVVDVLENDLPDVGLEVTEVTSPVNGMCAITEDGRVEYAPDEGFFGQDSCTYTACTEGTTDCDEGDLIVDVEEAPKLPPLAMDDPVSTDKNVPVTLDPLENDKTSDGPLVLVGVSDGEDGTCVIDREEGTVTYSPDEGYVGMDICIYTVCDTNSDLCDEGAIVVSVADTNEPPDAAPDAVTTPYETPVKIDATANDSDPDGDDLTITDVTQGLYGECAITDDNHILYTPQAGYSGPDICPYVVCDDGGECDTANVFIEVEEGPPMAVDDATATTPNTPVLVDVLENDSHPNDSPLTATVVSQPANGSCEAVANQVQYTPDEGFVGTDQCIYIACVEGTTQCDDAVVTVEVARLPPVAEDDRAETPPGTPVVTDVTENDVHPNGMPLEVIDIATQAENGVCEEIGGQVQYTPDEGFDRGSDRCVYIVCVVGDVDACDEATLVVDIIEPPTAVDDLERTPMDSPVVAYVVGNDVSPAGRPLEVISVSQPENGSCDFSADGFVQYNPDEGFLGTDQCNYVVCIQGTTTACDEAALIVDVVEVKIAENDEAEITMGTPVIVNVLNNDEEPEAGSLVIEVTSQPQNGKCEIVNTDEVQYSPDNGFYGTDECDYQVCVEGGPDDGACDSGTLVVIVVPQRPLAIDDDATTPIDTAVIVDVTNNDVHPNGLPLEVVDITNQPQNGICEVTVDGEVKYSPNPGFAQVDSCDYEICVAGTTACNDGTLTIAIVTASPTESPDESPVRSPTEAPVASPTNRPTPEPTATKGTPTRVPTPRPTAEPTRRPRAEPSGRPTARPSAQIVTPRPRPPATLGPTPPGPTPPATSGPTKKNTRPFAVDDFASTPTDAPVQIPVLDNDFDLDDDPLTVVSTTEPANGRVEINQDGTVTYTPDAGFFGEDTFTYTISDGNGGTDEAIVVVTVEPPPEPKPESPTDRPTATPAVTSCDDNCFEALDPEECPACDPVILPSCSDTTLALGALCESDGKCGLDDQLNNCEGTFDVYRRIPCTSILPGVCTPREGGSITVLASGDAYVASNEKDDGFDDETILVDDAPKTDGLIRWDLPEEVCECVTIRRATLRLYVVDPSRGGGFVHVTNPTWEEYKVTWSNAPQSSGPPLERIGRAANETWIDVDVTGLVSNSDEHVAVRIESCLKNRVQYASKEYEQGQYSPQLVIEFGPPPTGMHMLASRLDVRSGHYGRRMLGRKRAKRSSSESTKTTKTSESTSQSTSTDGTGGSGSSDIEDDGSDDEPVMPEIPVCPNVDPDSFFEAVIAEAKGDSTVVRTEPNESYGSDVLLELSPSRCGNMHAMINFDVKSVVASPYATVEYASILIHVIEGSDLIGATFLHTPASGWDEDGVTWNNAPEYDTVVGSLNTIQNGMWYEIDVTSAVQNLSSDHLSIRVVPSSVADAPCKDLRLIFASKELDGFGPRLVVVPKSSGSMTTYGDQLPSLQMKFHALTPKPEPKLEPKPYAYEGFVSFSKSGTFAKVREDIDECGAGSVPPDGGRIVVVPTDDAYVSPRRKSLNHGDNSMMIVDGKQGKVALMKFELSCLESKFVASAVLKLYSIDDSPDGGMVHVLTNDNESDWKEGDVNWRNAPTSSNPFAPLKEVRAGTWSELDISNAVVGNMGNFVTIIINSTSDNRVAYGAKEGTHAPQLIITYSEQHMMQSRSWPLNCAYPLEGSPLIVPPMDNAIIKEAERDTNFAQSAPNLSARDGFGSRINSLLKFTFSCVPSDSKVSLAVLKLYGKNRTPRGGNIMSVLGTWAEDSVTWDDAPSLPTDFREEIGRVRKGQWVEIDVTSAIVSAEGEEVTFRIEGSRGNAAFYGSKEDDAHAPKLEIFF